MASSLRPDVVYRVGDLPTSKPLRAWLAGLDVPQIHIGDGSWADPDARVSRRTIAPLGEILDGLPGIELPAYAGDWLERWRAADAQAADAITGAIGAGLSEPFLAAHLARWLPATATLFVAASMPIRDLESYQPALEDSRGSSPTGGRTESTARSRRRSASPRRATALLF